MSKTVVVVDYGLGNIYSVSRAVEKCGARPVLVGDPSAPEWKSADFLILPGVGAFADGMRGLRERGLIEPVLQYAASGRPFLGICLGMQMLFEEAEEFGHHQGLGLIPGKVIEIPRKGTSGGAHKIPHIGWSELRAATGRDDLLERAFLGKAVYFVHSFMAVPQGPADRVLDADYNGVRISAAVRRGNIYGCQFHPEKSGDVGLGFLKGFLKNDSF